MLEATQTATIDQQLLASYEGLVIKTASLNVGILKSMDFEDICQVLRVKVWKALVAWNPKHPRIVVKLRKGVPEEKLRDAFVFGCIRNQVKDLLKRNREQALLIEEIAPAADLSGRGAGARDRFEQHYLSVDPERVYQEVEEADPLIPSTLTHDERQVLVCLYMGYNGPETAERLGVERRKVATATRNIRRKMEDWRPTSAEMFDRPVREPDLVTV